MTNRRTIIKNAAAGFLSLFGIKAISAMDPEPQEFSIEPKIGQIEISFQDAIKIVRDHMQNDPGLWIAYQSNISMAIYDKYRKNENLGIGTAYFSAKEYNEYADEIMTKIFDAPRPECYKLKVE